MSKYLYTGTLVAVTQTDNRVNTHWREMVVVAESSEAALGLLWNACSKCYPQGEGYSNHSISVYQVPDTVLLEAARYALLRLDAAAEG